MSFYYRKQSVYLVINSLYIFMSYQHSNALGACQRDFRLEEGPHKIRCATKEDMSQTRLLSIKKFTLTADSIQRWLCECQEEIPKNQSPFKSALKEKKGITFSSQFLLCNEYVAIFYFTAP